jgi:hypothetical protein
MVRYGLRMKTNQRVNGVTTKYTEELDETVSKKQLNRRVSTFDHANCINHNSLVACRPSKTLAATLMSIGMTMTTQCCAM